MKACEELENNIEELENELKELEQRLTEYRDRKRKLDDYLDSASYNICSTFGESAVVNKIIEFKNSLED
jgi:predicted  nucleic acid-binding Zn-ribbon protein